VKRVALQARLAARLGERQAAGLVRSLIGRDHPCGVRVRRGGHELLSFCSNDYLGLAGDPRLVESLRVAAGRYGVGSGSAHLIAGHHKVHEELERALAEFLHRPRALLFSTGYMANLGVLGALLKSGDLLLEDRLNHASLLDGGRLSGARLLRYAHAEAAAAETLLQAHPDTSALLASDGVFSMDGDLAPLPDLAALCRRQGVCLMVDDAHGIGVLGPEGRGSVAAAGLEVDQVPILVGTLGKAFGTFGAFVAGSESLIEGLIQFARSYVYTTAPAPALAAATLTSLDLLRGADDRREHLQDLIAQFRHGVECVCLRFPGRVRLLDSGTPIQPLLVGEPEQAMALSRDLERQGILVTAIRPPTVPKGSARLRVTFSASHSAAQVDQLLAALDRSVSRMRGGPLESVS